MSVPAPELPIIAEDDSMLTRKFGREVANYFSGNPLNRVSFLRGDHVFLHAAFSHPTTKFLLMENLNPLVRDATRLAYVTREDVVPLTGEDPFAKSEQDQIKEFNGDETKPTILFLGLDEKRKTGFEFREYHGNPYFAVDVTPKGTVTEAAQSVVDAVKEKTGLSFLPGRVQNMNAPEAAMYANARALLDWNARNPFCGGCGQRTLSVNAGTKRTCPPTDLAGVPAGGPPQDRSPCPTRGVISNLSFPRTDPTCIMAVVSSDGTKILLGRQKRWPAQMYSTLAGFLEPGESIEEAVRREVWEESGVTVGRVVIHSSQPWPYPANLMIGAIGQALPGDGEKINLGNDPELEAAKWFPFEEVRHALTHGIADITKFIPEDEGGTALKLPPKMAIANQLMSAVVNGYLSMPTGNL